MDCHIELFHEGQWLEAAQVSFPDRVQNGFRADGCVFEYDLHYAFGDAPPVSLTYPVNADRHVLQSWPAFLYDLVPQGNGRRFLLDRMQLPDAQASDLPLLCAGAFNPIGRLRIREAVHYFERHVERHGLITDGFAFDELLARAPDFHEAMMVHGMLAAGGTGIQGVAPKYLLTEADDGKWYPDGALTDSGARRHFIVKRPRGPSEADRKVLRNEARYMEVAQRIGIRSFDLPSLHEDMLFIPRFDRRAQNGRVLRFHQESAASIAGLGGFGIQANQFDLLAAIRKVVDAPLEETIEFIRRDVLNLAMRNPDNHARNTAVQTVDGVTRLTPLFDFAPMYLDPEGITRAARWYHPATGKELQRWEDVLAHLALPLQERAQLVEALVRFGEQLATLADCMREAGVDEDIVDFVTPSIAAQRTQLLALRSS
ncbi:MULTISPECIES: type II toxin-antitoxin system HipA family toxin [unclassified Massilia]|uniref:type II toxin-antitoxin system HipA family toxin n=1 Tax=unclassified Massilia TaxID=2609279 RepID=UPI001786D8C6|nr:MULTISPECIES: HipA domain-containing protein [unclassified Massilia]MBD8529823.1 type II toxin-antitoxin system HipA family toxin [Massilia sp. CFBP 13647]MBD8672165.1 type II toxin-antitoxin system HipA family toxin [Massilia sp. CFBP 13721]